MSFKTLTRNSQVVFVGPKKINSFSCFGTVTPQGTNVEEEAPPTYWGTFAAGIYRIDYVGGARHLSFDPNCWFLDYAPGSAGNYELFYSGGEQDQHYPPGTFGCYPTAAALQAANAGASFVFTHTGGQIGMALDFMAFTDLGILLPYFRLCGQHEGLNSDVYFVGSKFLTLTSDVVFVTPGQFNPPPFFQLASDVVFVHPQVLNPNAIIPRGLCRDQLCCK